MQVCHLKATGKCTQPVTHADGAQHAQSKQFDDIVMTTL